MASSTPRAGSEERAAHRDSLTPLNILQLDAADRLVLQIADIRDNIQKKTFTKWVNKHLQKVNERVVDIFEDLRDGSRLLMLFEVLSKQSLPRERGKLRFHKLQNVKAALDFLNYKGIKVVNIRPDEIVDGNPKLTLGLIWTTILHFQVSDVQLPGQEELNAKQSLLLWSQLSVDGYPGVHVEDFSKSWRDGKAFLCIIHRNRPELVDMRRMHASTAQENLETAFSIAEEELGVTRLLDTEDMEVPDEKSVITYVSSLYKAFPKPVLSAAVTPKDNNALKTKLAEYEAVGRALLVWLKQQHSKACDKPLPTTLVEVKALLSELNKFRIEDIPNKLADKRKLEILFHEIENLSGHFPLDDEIHADKIAAHWDALTNAVDDRDAALLAEQARLQRLQKVAEKVHKDTKACEEYLYEVEKKIAEEEARHGVLHHADLRQTYDAAQQVLAMIGGHTDALLADAQGLRDGQYHQAESMYRRVVGIRQRMDGLTARLNGIATKARLPLATGGVRSSSASTTSSSGSVRRSDDLLRLRAVAGLPVLSPAAMSGLDMLNVCIDWMDRKRAELDQLPTDFGSDLRTVESVAARVRSDQQDVTALRSRLDTAFSARSTLPYDELAAFSQRTAKAEIAYSSLLSLANQRLRAAEGLLQFCRDASEELRWLEGTRRAAPAATGSGGSDAEQTVSAEAATDAWEPARLRQQFEELMTGLQHHEETFNQVQDRGEDLARSNQFGSTTVQRFLTTMQDEWGWLLQVTGCLESHQKQALTAQKFFADVDECRHWLEDQLAFLHQLPPLPPAKGSAPNGSPGAGAGSVPPPHALSSDRYLQRIQDLGAALSQRERTLKELESRSVAVVPARRQLLVPAASGQQASSLLLQCTAVTSYRHGKVSLVKGDKLVLTDFSSNPALWTVKDSSGAEFEVPAICLALCPPDASAKLAVDGLYSLWSDAIETWKARQFQLKVDAVFATMATVEQWESPKLKSVDVSKREAILLTLARDVEQLLQSPEATGADSSLLARLHSSLQRCKEITATAAVSAVTAAPGARIEKLAASSLEASPGLPQAVDDEAALKRLTAAAYSLQSLDQTLRLRHDEAVPRDSETLQKLVIAHKTFDNSMQQCATDLEELRQAAVSTVVSKRVQGFAEKADDMNRLSALYTQRLKLAEGIIATMDHISQVTDMLENMLSKQGLWSAEANSAISSRLEELLAEMSKRQPLIDGLDADVATLRENIASSLRSPAGVRQGSAANRQDLLTLAEDVAKLKQRWKGLRSSMASCQKKSGGMQQSWQTTKALRGEGNMVTGQKELTVQATYTSLYDRSPTLDRLLRSGGTSRSIQNKLEELYEELSRDLQQELKWSAHAMQMLAREEAFIPEDATQLQRRQDDYASLAEDVREHQQLARAVIQQNEQLREQQPPIVSPQEAYDQDVLHGQLLTNLDKISKEVEWRSRHLAVCQDDLGKVNSELHKFETWLQEAEALLRDLHERSSKLLSLKDASQRCQAFHSEVIARQADTRFLNMAAQKFAAESKSYQTRLVTFKAELQGGRASILIDSDGAAGGADGGAGSVREKVGASSQRYQRLLSSCEEESSRLARVNDCQRLFAEAAGKLDDWVAMAERNLSAFKREPVRTDLPGLQEQLDRVREFASAAMVQEKLVDELRARGSEYEAALAAVGASPADGSSGSDVGDGGGLAAEDARETVEDLACRHGLVVAEATARCNVLQTAMVQAEGVTASIDGLLAWASAAESALAAMKPISLIRENLDDQVHELRSFDADVESHRRSLAAINASAAEVLQSCHPKMAAHVQAKLAEVNARSEAVAARTRERARDLQEVSADLGEFVAVSSTLNDWLLASAETLDGAERGRALGGGEAAQAQESAVRRIQRDAVGERLAQLDSARTLGRRLKENPKTAQVAAIKDALGALEQNWAVFSETLGRVDQQARRRDQLALRFADLQVEAARWLAVMERRLDALEPVALDVGVIEGQIEAVQPLAAEYEEYAGRVNELADLCERCDGSSGGGGALSPKDGAQRHARLRNMSGSSPRRIKSLSPSSPTEKDAGLLTSSAIVETVSSGPLQKSDSDSSGISSKKSDSADGVATQFDDLTDMQRQLLEVTHGYDVIGDRLADRQSELRQTLRGLRTYLTDAQQALVFLDGSESELRHFASGLATAAGVASPQDDGDKDSLQGRIRKCQELGDQVRDSEPLLKQVRQAAYELTSSRENVPGRIQMEKQIAEIESRWNSLRDGVSRRRQSLASLEASSKAFSDTQAFLKSWLSQKEKMLVALGPFATDPQQGRVQLEQMQVLEDEVGAQQATYDQFLEAGMHVLEQAESNSELARVVNQQLDAMSQAWSAVEAQMRSRHDALRHVVVQSADLHDLLVVLGDWLAGAEQRLDDPAALAASDDAKQEMAELGAIRAETEAREKTLRSAQELSRKLCETIKQSSAQSDLRQKMQAVERPFRDFTRKLDARVADCRSRAQQGQEFETVCDDTLSWIQSSKQRLGERLLVSAKSDMLREQLRQHERLAAEIVQKKEEVARLVDKGQKLHRLSSAAAAGSGKQPQQQPPPATAGKLARMQRELGELTSAADARVRALSRAAVQAERFDDSLGKLQAWLAATEESAQRVTTAAPSYARPAVERQLREARALQEAVATTEREHDVVRYLALDYLGSVDVDKEGVLERVDEARARWAALRSRVDERARSLEDSCARLGQQRDAIAQIAALHAGAEEQLARHTALAPATRLDPQRVDELKAVQQQLKTLKAKVEEVKAMATQNGEIEVDVDSSTPAPRNVDAIHANQERLEAGLEAAVRTAEEAAQRVAKLQKALRSASKALNDLAETVDAAPAVARDAKTVREQMKEVQALELSLEDHSKTVESADVECAALVAANQLAEPAALRGHIDALGRQASRLKAKVAQRQEQLSVTLDELEKFSSAAVGVLGDLERTLKADAVVRPLGGSGEAIKQQQQEFKDFVKQTVDGLQRRVEQATAAGRQLVKSSAPGVDAHAIESTLDALNAKWSVLNERVSERDRKLDIAVLQTGKFKESVRSLTDWMAETEELMKNQRPPSVEYKVAKAQIQEQKFLQKMLVDRSEHMAMVKEIASQIGTHAGPAEKKLVDAEVTELQRRWEELNQKAQLRSDALDKNLNVTKAFHDKLEPLLVFVDKVERAQGARSAVAAEAGAIRDQLAEQRDTIAAIDAQKAELDSVLKMAADHLLTTSQLTSSGRRGSATVAAEEAQQLSERLASVSNRFSELSQRSRERLGRIEEALPLADRFSKSLQRLQEWIEETAEPSMAAGYGEGQALEKQLAEVETLYDSVTRDGSTLVQVAPGEGCERVSQSMASVQRHYAAVAEKIKKAAEFERKSERMKEELVSNMEGMSKWLADTGEQLRKVQCVKPDATALQSQLTALKTLNDDIGARRGHLQQLLATGQKLAADGVVKESAELGLALDALRQQSESLSQRAAELRTAAEQAAPLVAQFSSLNGELTEWLTAAEAEANRETQPTLDRDSLREQQDAIKLLQQDAADRRPVIERLNKVAPSLIKVCDRADAARVQQALDSANERYHSLRLAARERAQRLAADEQRLLQLGERLTVAHTELAAVEERLAAAERSEPVAARPDRLRDQLEASMAVVAEMERKLAELEHVRSTAAALLGSDSGTAAVDRASQAMQQKLDAMIEMYTQVKQAAQERSTALQTTLQASEVFWDDLNDLKLVLNELHDSFDNDDGIVLDPVAIAEEKRKLESMTANLDSANVQVNTVLDKGQHLHSLVGDTEKPEVGSVLTDVQKDYADLQRQWRGRYDAVQTALNRISAFQTQLGGLTTWIQYAEGRIAELNSAAPAADTGAVKAQIEAVNNLTTEVNSKYVTIESLNQEANVLSAQADGKNSSSVTVPLHQLNSRWQSLLDAIGAKKSQLQSTLLSLGQFQSAVEELEQWLHLTEQIVAEEQTPTLMYGDAKVLEIELAKQKILLNDVQAHQTSLDAINEAARQIVAAEAAAESSKGSGRSGASKASTRDRIASLNTAWEAMLTKTRAWEKALEDSMREAQAYRDEMNGANDRLNEIIGVLGVTKPVGGLPETAREQLEEFMVIYRELESQLQPRVGALIEKGEGLLGRCEEASRTALSQHIDQLQNTWDAVSEKAMEKKDKLEAAVEQAEKFQQDFQTFVAWLTRAEKALTALPPVGRVLDTVTAQKEEHRATQNDIAAMREAMTALDRSGTHLKYFSQKQDVTLIRNLLASVQQRWERLLTLASERGRLLDAGWRDAKFCHEQWTELCRWLEESERQLEAAAGATSQGGVGGIGADPGRIREELGKHKDFQRLLGSKQPLYDSVCRLCKDLKDRLSGGVAGAATADADGRVIDAMLSTLKAAWVSVCGKSVERQRRLEESLLISGQFREALQALLDWLCKVEPLFGDDQCVHGDVDTVSRLADQHEVFLQELGKRSQMLQTVRKTARDVVERSGSGGGEGVAADLQSQIVELNASWDKVGRLAEQRKQRLDEALSLAEDFSRRAHAFLDWVSDNEAPLRYYGDIADDEQGVRQQLDAHRIKYKEELEAQRIELQKAVRIGEAILSQCHPDAVPVMKQWMTILNTRFEEVAAWSQQKEERLQEALETLHSTSALLEELLGWLGGAEAALVAMANDPLPPDPETLEEMLLEHDDFEGEMSARQSDVNLLVKGATVAGDGRKSSLGNLLMSPGGGSSSGRITPSGRRSARLDQPGSRRTSGSATSEPSIRNPRVHALSLKWRQVWLMAIDRRRLLQDSLELQRERARLRNFNFEDWRRRYMEWMNHNKTRVMDFFRRMDKDRDGKVTRQEFTSGILQSKFPTSELELDAVANIFDASGEGLIDYREFMVALRGEGEKEADAKKSEAERITDEVAKQCSRCCCVKRYEIQKVADNKYTFGDTQKLRLVRILRSTVMVRVGGGWVALDEFLVKNDPCRAKGRTNSELREKFILSENVVGQTMSGFTARGPSGGRLSLSRSGTPAAAPPQSHSHSPSPSPHPHPHGSHYQSPGPAAATSLPQRGVTPDREVYQIMSMNRRYTSSNTSGASALGYGTLSPANGHSRSSSRASSRGAASDDGGLTAADSSLSSLPPAQQQQHTPSASRLPVPAGSGSRIPIVKASPRT